MFEIETLINIRAAGAPSSSGPSVEHALYGRSNLVPFGLRVFPTIFVDGGSQCVDTRRRDMGTILDSVLRTSIANPVTVGATGVLG